MPPIIAKKPTVSIPVFPENPVETIQASTIIVLHPGSMYLRLGRASEAYPHSLPQVIARRNRCGPTPVHKDKPLVPLVNMTPEVAASLDEIQNAISTVLASCLTTHGRLRYPVQLKTVIEHNERAKPHIVSAKSEISWTQLLENEDVCIGDEALYLNPNENFNIHWPMRRGELNLHSGLGGSMSAVLSDLEAIWGMAIQKYLSVPLKELKYFRVVLVIPDSFKREHVKEIIDMLLMKMGFSSCFVHLESVCATFGAGVSCACVVDVGDQKTAVSCVEDGICYPNTRICMNYGGGDITQLFYWLLAKNHFPYLCMPDRALDAAMLQELKEKLCHVNLDICGVQDRSFLVKRPNEPVLRYVIKVGDECLIAPLALFHPELFGMTGMKRVVLQERCKEMPEDPHDEIYLIQTQRRGIKDTSENPLEQSLVEDSHLNVCVLDDDMDSTEAPANVSLNDIDPDFCFDQLYGVDHAIVKSIEQCDSDEVKMKMYSCILLVGGGMMFPGIHTWLKNRLQVQIPVMFRNEQMEIITRPKDMDPRTAMWKGAAVMSCLDAAQELWIRQKEWSRYNVKILRERAPFTW